MEGTLNGNTSVGDGQSDGWNFVNTAYGFQNAKGCVMNVALDPVSHTHAVKRRRTPLHAIKFRCIPGHKATQVSKALYILC